MKIRTGFVSNSSSSSFICDVCGNVEAGYDLSIEDAKMYECENGHEVCQHHIKEDFDGDIYELPAELCPICRLETIKDSDMLAYILKSQDILKGDIENEITEQFENYKEFQKYLKGE